MGRRDGERPRRHFSTTSSARASSAGGIVRPSAVAVLRLITNSNLVGGSTGRSVALATLRILSANPGIHRSASGLDSLCWRGLAGHLLRGPPMKSNRPGCKPTPRSGRLVSVHLDLDVHGHPTYLVKAERITAHPSLDRNGRLCGSLPDPITEMVQWVFPARHPSGHLGSLLPKDELDGIHIIRSRLCSFPHAGHIDRYQRPVDPVLLRTTAREHKGYPDDDPSSCSHTYLSLGGTLAHRAGVRQGRG